MKAFSLQCCATSRTSSRTLSLKSLEIRFPFLSSSSARGLSIPRSLAALSTHSKFLTKVSTSCTTRMSFSDSLGYLDRGRDRSPTITATASFAKKQSLIRASSRHCTCRSSDSGSTGMVRKVRTLSAL